MHHEANPTPCTDAGGLVTVAQLARALRVHDPHLVRHRLKREGVRPAGKVKMKGSRSEPAAGYKVTDLSTAMLAELEAQPDERIHPSIAAFVSSE